MTKVNARLARHGEALSDLREQNRAFKLELHALKAMIGVIIETINPTRKPKA